MSQRPESLVLSINGVREGWPTDFLCIYRPKVIKSSRRVDQHVTISRLKCLIGSIYSVESTDKSRSVDKEPYQVDPMDRIGRPTSLKSYSIDQRVLSGRPQNRFPSTKRSLEVDPWVGRVRGEWLRRKCAEARPLSLSSSQAKRIETGRDRKCWNPARSRRTATSLASDEVISGSKCKMRAGTLSALGVEWRSHRHYYTGYEDNYTWRRTKLWCSKRMTRILRPESVEYRVLVGDGLASIVSVT